MTKALQQAYLGAKDWLDGLADRGIAARADVSALRNRFKGPLPEGGSSPEAVVAFLDETAREGLLGCAGGRFFAWVIGGALESALAADWLVSAWDQNAALYACGPAVSAMEEAAGRWLKDLLDLPRNASFAFTTGCQLAHVTGLAAARHALLKKGGWDVEKDGLFGAPPITLLASSQRHESVDRAVRFLGIGTNAVVSLEPDDHGRIRPSTLRDEMGKLKGPAIVVLNAADLNIGACDRFTDLIPIARERGTWVHVDGAFGLFARASRSRRGLVEGVELADSWAVDAHKWLNVPFDCGMAIVRDTKAHKAAMSLSAPYLTATAGMRDPIDWNPEWSRRARGVPVYAALMQLGRGGVEALVDRCCGFCADLVEGIGALPGVEILARPSLNQGLLRFYRPAASPEENDAYTDRTIARINATGAAFFSGTTWRNRRAMRVSVVNWRTDRNDVQKVIAAIASVLGTDEKVRESGYP